MATGDNDRWVPYRWLPYMDDPKSGPVEPSRGVRSFTREGHLRRGKVLRKSLAALEYILGADWFAAPGRRAISELVLGALDNWSWGYACIAGQHSSDAFTLSVTFRYHLELWVVTGTDSRVELQECLRLFIAALDTERAEGQG